LALTALGQNPSGFEKMATKMEGNAAPIITREQLIKEFESNKNIVLLDSREKDEFEVSHLPNAKWVGFKDYHFDVLKNISKDTEIVVYCSVGYRSGKTAEKLIKKGYTKVYNLYGGIFDWANNNKTLEKTNGDTTKEVHGYNQKWSEYLNSEVTKPIVK
jgi:rhodanese-related sulfurtransferase